MRTTVLLWILAFVAGALIPVQAASNAALSRAIQGNVPFARQLFSSRGLAAALDAASGKGSRRGELREAPWWSYSGGAIVAFYVLTITFSSRGSASGLPSR